MKESVTQGIYYYSILWLQVLVAIVIFATRNRMYDVFGKFPSNVRNWFSEIILMKLTEA